MKYDKAWLPYLVLAAILLLLAAYAMMPKAAPSASMSIGAPQLLQSDNTSVIVRIPITWDAEIQPTYLAVDVQPKGAPEVIALEDRDKYHLIRAPQNWVNVKTTFAKKATVNYDCLIESNGNEDLVIKAKISNDDLKDVEAIARAEAEFSLNKQGTVTS